MVSIERIKDIKKTLRYYAIGSICCFMIGGILVISSVIWDISKIDIIGMVIVFFGAGMFYPIMSIRKFV